MEKIMQELEKIANQFKSQCKDQNCYNCILCNTVISNYSIRDFLIAIKQKEYLK